MNIRKAFLHKAVSAACALFAAGTIFAADRADLMGYVPGAEVMKVDVTDGRIDTISGIIYSQIKSQRSIRQLRMTVMTPRTKARNPAVVPELPTVTAMAFGVKPLACAWSSSSKKQRREPSAPSAVEEPRGMM